MKKYYFDENGMKQYDGAMDLDGTSVDKSVQILSGDGQWMNLFGVRLFVDESGIVIRGYDTFIGRRFSDLERLNFTDIFNVQRSVQRAVGATHKAQQSSEDLENRDRILKSVEEYINKRIKEEKANENNIRFEREG